VRAAHPQPSGEYVKGDSGVRAMTSGPLCVLIEDSEFNEEFFHTVWFDLFTTFDLVQKTKRGLE
jgi:hypothetical protein